MTNPRAVVLVILAGSCLAAAAIVAARQDPKVDVEKAWNEWSSSLTGDIVLGGRVVSKTGEPLSKVAMRVETSYLAGTGLDHREETEQVVIDLAFHKPARI